MALKNFMAARGERDEDGGNGAAAAAARPARTVSPATSIDATSEFKGTLRCKETIRIDGRVEGEVVCDKMVIVGEGAKVHANIVADTVQVAGEAKGDITARRKLTLSRTARVIGNLSTPGIVIEEGAKLEGRIVIGSDEEKPQQTSKPAAQTRQEAKTTRTAPKAAAPASA
jgi:cytoskeletal protein CcmA (bactofilin family)